MHKYFFFEFFNLTLNKLYQSRYLNSFQLIRESVRPRPSARILPTSLRFLNYINRESISPLSVSGTGHGCVLPFLNSVSSQVISLSVLSRIYCMVTAILLL